MGALQDSAIISLKPDGRLRIGVVADSHSSMHVDGIRHLAATKPDVILHAGDIGERRVLGELEAIAPVHAVRGNIDPPGLPDGLTLTFAGTHGPALIAYLTHIAVAGPKIRAEAARAARAANAKLIVCGHSHVPFLTQDRGLTLFNPGSIGPRRFRLPILFGIIEIEPTSVSLRHVDAETGARWLP